MERAQAHEVRAALLQLHIATDDIDDIDPVEQVLNERLWNHGVAGGRVVPGSCLSKAAYEDTPGHHGVQMGAKRAFQTVSPKAIHFAKATFTSPDTAVMSARPASLDFSTAITLPISCGPEAPVAATAAATSAWTSASDKAAGM